MSPHDRFIKEEMERRKGALEYVDDVSKLAEYIGGEVENLGLGEDWAIKKEFFPGVEIFFIYNREFPSSLRVLYSGKRVKSLPGEDLVEITLACLNHMLRYIREANPEKKLPEICYRV